MIGPFVNMDMICNYIDSLKHKGYWVLLLVHSTDELCVLLAHSPCRHALRTGEERGMELSAKIKFLSIAMPNKACGIDIDKHAQTEVGASY